LSPYRIAINELRTTRILGVKTESPTVKTFAFKDKLCAKAEPGQFLMLWIPGVDEIPLSILDAEADDTVSVAVKNVGEATQALHSMKAGEIIGVRGPFGNAFTLKEKSVLMVAGGTGTAPLFFLAKRRLASKAKRTVFVLGAKTESELLFMGELGEMLGKEQLVVSTEDGTCGITGLCTVSVEQLLANEKFDLIHACGPEPMILRVSKLADRYGIRMEASLERLMRCAIGLCGTCVIGRYQVCADGPVFTREQLREVKEEFGVAKRDFDGRKIPLC
jgi:dihydroorotate dehydrogenase electron transfer subunit